MDLKQLVNSPPQTQLLRNTYNLYEPITHKHTGSSCSTNEYLITLSVNFNQLLGTFSIQWDSFQKTIDKYKDAAWMRLGIFIGSQAMIVYMQASWANAFSDKSLNSFIDYIQRKRVKAVTSVTANLHLINFFLQGP